MSDRAIEPSEIIVEQQFVHTKPNRVNPWIRLIARFFDYSLFFLILFCVYRSFPSYSPFGKLIPFEYILWIPIEALLLATWGTTPGKWFLKTHLRFSRSHKPEFSRALRRSFLVWFRGLGMMVPVLNIVCLLVAFNRLKLTQITSWDNQDHIHVNHDPIARWRLGFAALVAFGGLIVYFAVKNTTKS